MGTDITQCTEWSVVQTLAGAKDSLFSKTQRPARWLTQSPVQWVVAFIPRGKWQAMMLTSQLHLVPRLRMSGDRPLFPPCMPSWYGQRQLYHFTSLQRIGWGYRFTKCHIIPQNFTELQKQSL